jgi:hypothetical protein
MIYMRIIKGWMILFINVMRLKTTIDGYIARPGTWMQDVLRGYSNIMSYHSHGRRQRGNSVGTRGLFTIIGCMIHLSVLWKSLKYLEDRGIHNGSQEKQVGRARG